MRITSRHHLRSDAVKSLTDALWDQFRMELDATQYELVELADTEFDIVLVDGEPLVFQITDEIAPTVRGANTFPPTKNIVTVDAGAVSFISDGADVMRPGIVAADESITTGALVIITEETHGKVLAIGRAMVSGEEMLGDSGKVVESVHYVSDELYEFSP